MVKASNSRSGGAGWVVAAVMAVIAAGQCSKKTPSTASEISAAPMYVSVRSLNCRDAASPDAPVVRSFARNERVSVLAQEGEWSKIDASPDCWAASRFLSDGPSVDAMASTRSDSQVNSLMSGGYSPDLEPRRTRHERTQGARSPGGSHFSNCAEARASGAAPVRAGDPGYSRRLDRDGDGVGCE